MNFGCRKTVLINLKCCIYHYHVLINIDKIVNTCANWYVYMQNFNFF